MTPNQSLLPLESTRLKVRSVNSKSLSVISKRGVDTNDEDYMFSDDDDNIEFNSNNSVLTRQTPSGKRHKNGQV